MPSPEEAKAYPYTAAERARVAKNRERLFVGSPKTIMTRLAPLIQATMADEIMIVTAIYDHEARKRSYSLMAKDSVSQRPSELRE